MIRSFENINFSTRVLILIVVTFYSTLISLSKDLNDFGFFINLFWPVVVGVSLIIIYTILNFTIKSLKVKTIVFCIFCLWILYDGIILALNDKYEYLLFDIQILDYLRG